MVYLFYSIFFFAISLFVVSQKKTNKDSYVIIALGIILFWGLSYIHAADTNGYIAKFNSEINTIPGIIDTQFEIGYTVLAMLFKTILPKYWFFQFVVFGVGVFLIIKGLSKLFNPKDALILIPLLFFFYPSNLAAFRQGMATVIFIYALHVVGSEKIKQSLLFVALIFFAALFHKSVMVLLLIYPARFIKTALMKDWLLVALLIISDYIWLSGISLVPQLDAIVPFLESETYGEGGGDYARFIENFDSEGTFAIAKVLEINVTVLLYTFLCKGDKYNWLLRYNLIIYLIICFGIGGFLAHRLNYYWEIVYYSCFIRGVIELFRQDKRHLISYTLIALYFIWFFIFKSGYINYEYHFLFGY